MKINKKNAVKTEYQECVDFIAWCDAQEEIKGRVVHFPNEAAKTHWEGHRQKLIGTRAGYPDYTLNKARHGYFGLHIEMKRTGTENEKKRENQQEWIDHLNDEGYYAVFCCGKEKGVEVLKWYLSGQKTAHMLNLTPSEPSWHDQWPDANLHT